LDGEIGLRHRVAWRWISIWTLRRRPAIGLESSRRHVRRGWNRIEARLSLEEFVLVVVVDRVRLSRGFR